MNDLPAILADKQLKPKAKVEAISQMLLAGDLALAELITTAKAAKGSAKGTCVEAIEFTVRAKPELATLDCLKFVTDSLADPAPRVRWESAKIIAAIAHLYPGKLNKAIANLLTNTEFPGTVVRWSAAVALAEIVKLNTKNTKALIPALQAILRSEPDNAIKKIYLNALKSFELSKASNKRSPSASP